MRDVEDRDRGWKDIKLAAARADGLELRVGIMNSRLKYPGGTEIGKVAGILKIYEATGAAYDESRGDLDSAFERLHTFLLRGGRGIADYIYRQMGEMLKERMRQKAMAMVQRRTGRMEESIRATVFESVRVGRRGPAHVGTVAAGDDPKRPRPSERM